MAKVKSIGVGMIGCGTVGGGVAKLLRQQAQLYADRLGVAVELRKVLVRNRGSKRSAVPASLLTDNADDFFSTPDMPIIIEVAGGRGVVSQYVRRALAAGKHVVTANKALLAGEGPELFALARKHHASIAFEASCAGGIPVITALKFGLMANNIRALYGILNGTCNYILTEMTQQGKDYATALREAQEKGFAEADPTMDVSGRDAAQKLAILSSLAFGMRVDENKVTCEGIDRLDQADIRFGGELGYVVKLLGIAEQSDSGVSLGVEPCFISADLPLAKVHGSFNALSIFGDAVGQTMYYGRGAGEMPTASAVVSDVLNVASGWYPLAFEKLNLWPDRKHTARLIDASKLVSRFYVRMSARDVPGVMAKVTRILGQAGISLSAVMQHEVAAGQFVPVVVVTHHAKRGAVLGALRKIAKLDAIKGSPVCVRMIDLPNG